MKILSKTLDTTKLSPEKCEFWYYLIAKKKAKFLNFYVSVEIAALFRENKKTKTVVLKNEEVRRLIDEQERIEKEEEAQKKREADARPSSST